MWVHAVCTNTDTNKKLYLMLKLYFKKYILMEKNQITLLYYCALSEEFALIEIIYVYSLN